MKALKGVELIVKIGQAHMLNEFQVKIGLNPDLEKEKLEDLVSIIRKETVLLSRFINQIVLLSH